MESWRNIEDKYDKYIQWIEYSLLMNVREMTSLCNGCTHIADWRTSELTRVTLKKIVDEENDQLFDFHQVNYFTCKMQIVFTNVCIARLTTVFVYSSS